jgi:hypothetical protein
MSSNALAPECPLFKTGFNPLFFTGIYLYLVPEFLKAHTCFTTVKRLPNALAIEYWGNDILHAKCNDFHGWKNTVCTSLFLKNFFCSFKKPQKLSQTFLSSVKIKLGQIRCIQ